MVRIARLAVIALLASWMVPRYLLTASASDLPEPSDVAAKELFRLSEPCDAILESYSDQGFTGIVTSGSGLYRFKPNGERELIRRLHRPTAVVQRQTGSLWVADAAVPGLFHVPRTPAVEPYRGTSVSNGTEARPLRTPAWLVQELRHVAAGANGAEVVVGSGGVYLSDLGAAAADKPSGLIFYVAPIGMSSYETSVVALGLAAPQGMAMTKDGNTLYVAERDANRILAFPVTWPGSLGEPKVLAKLPTRDEGIQMIEGQPAGLCLDDAGRIYVAHGGLGAIQVLDANGHLLRTYDAGMRWPTAIAFGGRGRTHLYVAGRTGNDDDAEGVVAVLDLGVPGQRILLDTF